MAIVHTNDTIKTAVNLYLVDKNAAVEKYGPINTWNTSQVTDMSELFEDSYFDEDISNWDVSNVKNFNHMFYCATSFNQDLSKWKPNGKEYTVRNMFCHATSFVQDFQQWYLVTNLYYSYTDDNPESITFGCTFDNKDLVSRMMNTSTGIYNDPKLKSKYRELMHLEEEEPSWITNSDDCLFD